MSSQRTKRLLSTDWSYFTFLNVFKLCTLLIEKGSRKRYATLTTLAVVWALSSFNNFTWSELYWWALKELNGCCLQINRILRSLTLLSWALCWSRSVATSDIATLKTRAKVWAFWSFNIFIWSELYWWLLKELNGCCLQIDRLLHSLNLLGWALCWSRRVATRDMQRSQFWQ